MSDPYIAQIAIFPYTFAPRSWSFCEGQTVALNQYTALFSLIGTYYGGDGRSTMSLPNFKGRCGIQQGTAPGLSYYNIGNAGGTDTQRIIAPEMPAHTHEFTNEFGPDANTNAIAGHYLSHKNAFYEPTATNGKQLNGISNDISDYTGGSQPHDNMMPYTVLNFCIAMDGQYPSRN